MVVVAPLDAEVQTDQRPRHPAQGGTECGEAIRVVRHIDGHHQHAQARRAPQEGPDGRGVGHVLDAEHAKLDHERLEAWCGGEETEGSHTSFPLNVSIPREPL